MKILYRQNSSNSSSIVVQLLLMALINTVITTTTTEDHFSSVEEEEEEDIDSSSLNAEQYTTNLINRKLPPTNYSKNIRPNVGASPVLVNISMRINDLSEISETSMVKEATVNSNKFSLSFPLTLKIEKM